MAKLNPTQAMTLESPTVVGGARVDLQQLTKELEADGFSVVSVSTIPDGDDPQGGVRFRIIATYPIEWVISGWKKGRA